jgi:hypothetical protein
LPTTKQAVVVGQLTAVSGSDVLPNWTSHVPPKSVVERMVESFAEAKHAAALGQLMPVSRATDGMLSVRQLAPPSEVAATSPAAPLA